MKSNAVKLASLLGCALAVMVGRADEVLDQFLAECRAPAGSPVELGVWNGDLDACKKVADENGIPMVAIWSNSGCAHCKVMERALLSDTFREWAKTCGLVLHFSCSLDPKGQRQGTDPGGSNNTIGTGTGSYKAFCKRPNNISNYPHVRFYWYENGKKIVDYSVLGDTVDNQTSKDPGSNPATYNKAGQVVINYILQKSGFGAYTPKSLVSYSGGVFVPGETDGNRLEAENGTREISFEMIREEKAAESATNNTVKVVGPNGAVAQEVTVDWKVGQTNQTVTVDVSKVAFSKDGDKALLIAVDADGNEQATNSVTYVSGNSSGNPLWIGERVAVAKRGNTPVLEYGEWTMDLDVAKAKVAAAGGEAYTLVAILGSLWCHDCANTERNFTGVNDAQGNNRFAAWAKANNVALVALDIPNFSTNSVECASPTLLSRSAYTTTLAYELPSYGMYDVSKGGAPESLTNPMMRSGLGYLTSKGVSDADARKVLERNHKLVTTDFTEGGFRTAADSNKFRTGVPIFVLLDKAGNVKARLTRFASVSPMADAKSKWDDVIKRFDEMLAIAKTGSAHADGGVIEDDFPGAGIHGIAAAGGSVKGEISHCDLRDTYKLENFDGNAFLVATASGLDDAEVTLSFVKLGADGKKVTVASQTGALNDTVLLSSAIETSGEFFIEISGSGDNNAFSVFNPAKQAFHAYEIDCDLVLIPGEMRSKAVAPKGSSTVSMLIEADTLYRIEGLASDHGAALQKVADNFYVSTVETEEGFSYEDMKTATPGGTVVYQRWEPGVVGFVSAKRTVSESVGDVKVDFARELGSSGAVTVRVSVDESATTLYNSDGAARFEFAPVEFTWAEGESGTASAVVTVKDDARFDGPGVVALKLEVVSSENSDVEAVGATYTLTVNEDDKQDAGQVAFSDADPFFSKAATVYAKENKGATVYAERFYGSDGWVSAKINVNGGAKLEIGGVATNVVAWANHKYERQAVKVTGIAAGKSATLTLASPTDGLNVLSAAGKVTVVSVAADAPEFAQDADSAALYRYVASSNVYPVVLADGAAGAKLTFTKLSGTLPAGLKAAWDVASNALAVFGAPTAKEGVYTAVYQVTQQVGATKTPGLTIELTYEVSDPTVASMGGAPYNAAVAKGSNGKGGARTFKDIPVIDVEAKRLMGVVQATIPQTGKVSAKYTCSDGAISFSSKGWTNFAAEGDKSLTASLVSSKKGYAMELVANNDGSVEISIVTPETDDDKPLEASCEGSVWSKDDNASEWAGYYTVGLENASVAEDEGYAGLAPRGNGYLTLKMNTTSAVNSGTVTWAGMLPNGTAVSGSAILCRDDCDGAARLPVFKSSSTDVLAALVDLCEGGVVQADRDADTYWHHGEKYDATTYDVKLDPYGRLYSDKISLLDAYNWQTTPTLAFDVAGLGGWLDAGTPEQVAGVEVTVSEKTLAVAKANAVGAKLSFNRATGVVTGSFNLPYKTEAGVTKTVAASYKGVVLIGKEPPDCGCGDGEADLSPQLPFVTGAFYIADKVLVNNGKKDVQVKVKRGGAVAIQNGAGE